MQTTNQKEGIDIVEGTKIIAIFMGFKFNAYPHLKHNNITKPDENEWFVANWDLDDFNQYIPKWFRYDSSFDCLVDAVIKFQNLPPIPAFPQWVTWCEQINNTLIKTYEPLQVFYVLVEAVKDYNLHASGQAL